jgi:hypothetical protein
MGLIDDILCGQDGAFIRRVGYQDAQIICPRAD